MKPTITPIFEQPELGLAGPILYRGYQIEEGIRAIEEKRRQDEEYERTRPERERKAAEIVNQSRPQSGWAAAGTFIARPLRRNEDGSIQERTPLINPTPPPPTDNPFHDPDVDMDDEDTPLISSEGIRGRNVNTAPDLEDVDLSDEPPRQPPQTSSSIPRPTGNQIAAGGAAVAAGAAIGASTYIEATTRTGTSIPRLPQNPPPSQPPQPPPEPPPTPINPPPNTSDPVYNLPTEDPYNPNDTQPNPPPIQPEVPPPPNTDMDIDLDTTELVVVKELRVPISRSSVPALLTGVTLGSVATGLYFLL